MGDGLLQPVGVLHDPTVVAMSGSEDGIAIDLPLTMWALSMSFGLMSLERSPLSQCHSILEKLPFDRRLHPSLMTVGF